MTPRTSFPRATDLCGVLRCEQLTNSKVKSEEYTAFVPIPYLRQKSATTGIVSVQHARSGESKQRTQRNAAVPRGSRFLQAAARQIRGSVKLAEAVH